MKVLSKIFSRCWELQTFLQNGLTKSELDTIKQLSFAHRIFVLSYSCAEQVPDVPSVIFSATFSVPLETNAIQQNNFATKTSVISEQVCSCYTAVKFCSE